MRKGTWFMLAVCSLLGGCADLVLSSSPTALTALEPDAPATEADARTAMDLPPGEPASIRPTRKAVHRPAMATQESAPTSSTSDGAALAAKRAQEEWLTQRERIAKRAVSGICTGC